MSPNVNGLFQKISTMPIDSLKKNKNSIISQILKSKYTPEEQVTLRKELQRRLIESTEKTNKIIMELQSTENEIKYQCSFTSDISKKLVESDSKLSKIKRSQELITQEMQKAQKILQQKKQTELKEELFLLGALGIFLATCIYVLINRLASG
ncbi:hypothetical protein NEOKW01_0615 [Nematocida sp. AWRm80]|nr:hypothetical protein NEOKW01_0615 [Nematocida sp. AWRm80]